MPYFRIFCFLTLMIFSPIKIYAKSINVNQKAVALTFDDGPSKYTEDILKVLNHYDANATFFIVGEKIVKQKKVLKKLISNGNELANHTYSHKWLTKEKDEIIIEEINKTNQLALQHLNYKFKYFRPAYGALNKRVRKVVDLKIILWNLDSRDWKIKNSKTIAYNIAKKVKDEDIILMHDLFSRTVNTINILIPLLKKEGFQFITISELLELKRLRQNEF